MTAATQRSTVVGVFEDRRQANEAVSELINAGFRQDQIGVAMRTCRRGNRDDHNCRCRAFAFWIGGDCWGAHGLGPWGVAAWVCWPG